MIFQAYNETAVRNLQLREMADNLLENGDLTPPQYEQVKTVFPIALKQSNVFVRLGLFLFTSLCIGFSIALIGWMAFQSTSDENNVGILCLFFGLSLTTINEYMIKERHWYRQGSDNALCYAAVACFVWGFALVFKIDDRVIWTLLTFVFLTIAAVRYGDPLLALGAFFALMISVFEFFKEKENTFMALTLVWAGLSVGVYFWTKYMSKKETLFYWKDCFMVLEKVGLAGFYLSLNYYFLAQRFENSFAYGYESELSNEGENEILMPFSTLFALLTAFIPLIYLFLGIKNKDRTLWVMGGLGIAASILTYRHYHSIMPIEWALTLAGIVFLALAYFLMTYLKTPRAGFVYLPKQNKNGLIEALVINQVLQQTAADAPDDSVKYGGGDFGGGGASGDF